VKAASVAASFEVSVKPILADFALKSTRLGGSTREQGGEMVPASLTAEQAGDLIAQLRAVLAGHGQFLDIVMPNGKKMSDCTSQYVTQVGQALHRLHEASSQLSAA